MSRLFWYPVLSATAIACCAPVFAQGVAGIPEAMNNVAVAIVAVLHLP